MGYIKSHLKSMNLGFVTFDTILGTGAWISILGFYDDIAPDLGYFVTSYLEEITGRNCSRYLKTNRNLNANYKTFFSVRIRSTENRFIEKLTGSGRN